MDAIAQFRRRWATKARRPDIEALPIEQLLADAELLLDGELTYAALVLLGSHHGLGRLLGQCEVVYEYRAEDASIAPQFRREFRNGFFLFQDSLWELIDARNNRYSYQEGLFRYDLPAFNEEAVREALLNAVSHRDYRLPGSIFVRQYPTRLEIVSPGGFPPGVTADNIIYKQSPRNRRIAEALARCGLVERSGQGADRMFSTAIREGKLPPDFDGTDAHQVAVTLHGAVQDGAFLVFLERLASEQAHNLHIKDLLLLDAIHRQLPISSHLRAHVEPLLELGAIERVGRGRGVRYLLSRRFYQTVGKQGAYTRKRGLDRETNKALLLKHIERRRTEGCQLSELQEVLPSLSKWQVQTLLREMKQAGVVHSVGHTRAGRWFPGPAQEP